ncbi:hypothetical protein [Methylobacterium sp. SI9]|uniref:hypothetical protein n=1 Tax=Methylobacterium guangdongense TaxID=3138811 RepID=UPI00313CEF34
MAYRSIVLDTATRSGRGDLGAAISRVKDLDIASIEVEPSLMSRSAKEWHRIDNAIDRAFFSLRA